MSRDLKPHICGQLPKNSRTEKQWVKALDMPQVPYFQDKKEDSWDLSPFHREINFRKPQKINFSPFWAFLQVAPPHNQGADSQIILPFCTTQLRVPLGKISMNPRGGHSPSGQSSQPESVNFFHTVTSLSLTKVNYM